MCAAFLPLLLQSSGGKWQGFIVPQISLCSAVIALLNPSDQPKVTSILNSIANVNMVQEMGRWGWGEKMGERERERENVIPYDRFYHPLRYQAGGLRTDEESADSEMLCLQTQSCTQLRSGTLGFT